VGIELELPDTLGQLVRDLVIQEDVKIHKITYMKFLMFLERCKGFEEDAKKFLMLVTQQSSHLQIDYEMCRPFVVRILRTQGGPEMIKFFEQLRKNIVLNQSWNKAETGSKNSEQRRIRKEFFDGLIIDLMKNESYTLAEIVMAEKLKEKF
jgi:hypothetical protein